MTYPIFEFREEVISELERILNCEIRLEVPPEELGDFAFPCFPLSPLAKKPAEQIAKSTAPLIEKRKWIGEVRAKGGYINFYVDHKRLASSLIETILEMDERYGSLPSKNVKVIIEHTSANPNGPLHVGRARNPIIGDTLVRIFKFAGYEVESQFYLDDMGKQVAILAWGINNIESIPPKKKPDHEYAQYYQIANKLMEEDAKVEKDISQIIKKTESGDPETLKMIKNAYTPVLEGIKESLRSINIEIDRYVPESKFIKDVKKVVEQLKKHAKEEDGAFYLDVEQGKFFFLRKDGTTLYATRDIAYHQWKAKRADLLINVLGEDHKLESKQVETGLKVLGIHLLPKPLFYAFVTLPEGKMSTRKGYAIYLDELIDECKKRALEEVKKRRSNLSEKKMKEIAEIVGIGALRYNIIKVQPEKDIVFKWEEALNFEGDAAPFIQYAHARACSILSKAEKKGSFTDLRDKSEIRLVKQLAKLPLIIEKASSNFKPHIVANYLYETAWKFNQFYRDCPVISEEEPIRSSRIALVDATRIVLRNGLDLLGIKAPKEM